MAICRACGKEYSIWTAQNWGGGTCNECVTGSSNEEKEQSFDCKIPDTPLNKTESVQIGLTSMGAYRGNFRNAAIRIIDGELRLSAKDANGNKNDLLKVDVPKVTKISSSPINLGSQVSLSVGRAFIFSAGIAIVLFVAMITQVSRNKINIPQMLGFALVGGLVIGFLFSFLPSLFQLHEDLLQLTFHLVDNQVLVIAVTKEQRERAFQMLQAVGLSIEEKAEPDASADGGREPGSS
jgi:hypothetical protein